MSRSFLYTDPLTHELRVTDQEPPARLCDFCGAEEIHHLFLTNDPHEMPHLDSRLPRSVSTGPWAACRPCAEDINAERWDAVHARALEAFVKRHGVPHRHRTQVRVWLARTHEAFRQARRRGDN